MATSKLRLPLTKEQYEALGKLPAVGRRKPFGGNHAITTSVGFKTIPHGTMVFLTANGYAKGTPRDRETWDVVDYEITAAGTDAMRACFSAYEGGKRERGAG